MKKVVNYFPDGVKWKEIAGGEITLDTFYEVRLGRIIFTDANGHKAVAILHPGQLRELSDQLTFFADQLELQH